jgi:hypothetical protein
MIFPFCLNSKRDAEQKKCKKDKKDFFLKLCPYEYDTQTAKGTNIK